MEKQILLEGKNYQITLNDNIIPHISKKNTKIKNTLIWSLPPIRTCPKRTKECEAKCYALKFYRVNSRVRNAWEENFELTLKSDFISKMINEIKLIQNKKRYGYFRINDSGDFYNQKYLSDWIEIAKAFPEIKFLAYTKSFHLDYSKIPVNFNVLYSVFPDSKVIRTDLQLAYLDGCAERGNTFHCVKGSRCENCRICWETNYDVKFSLH